MKLNYGEFCFIGRNSKVLCPGSLSTVEKMQSLNRFVQALRVLAMSHNTSLRLTDVADEIDLSKATTGRLLDALCSQGLAQYNKRTKAYSLGRELMFLGLSAARSFPFDDLVRPIIQDLAAETGDGIFCALRAGNHMVTTDKVFGDYPVKTDVFPVGGRRPLGVGSNGLAILGTLSAEEAEKICSQNEREILKYPGMSVERLLREAAVAREQGYCLTEAHMVEGVSALGAPIRDRNGLAVGAMSIVGVKARFANGRWETLVKALLKSVKRAEEALFHDSLVS